ncbi:MAG TPA: hypothetical protein VHP11_16400 [Tepidisphaeraceae bacterium]|nr:hypothetical protein [Tepidisphaeraceae bacterium]
MFGKLLASVVLAAISAATLSMAGCSLNPGATPGKGDQPIHLFDRPTDV